jgi:hypothetical protein
MTDSADNVTRLPKGAGAPPAAPADAGTVEGRPKPRLPEPLERAILIAMGVAALAALAAIASWLAWLVVWPWM